MIRSALLVFLALAACGSTAPPSDFVPLKLDASAVPFDARDPARTGAGRLKYLGGLDLNAKEAWFGGLSSLRCNARCYAVGDAGLVVAFDLVEIGERLVGVRNVTAAALLDSKGETGTKLTRDAESLVLSPGGSEALIGFERSNGFWVVPLGGSRWQAKREYTLPEMAAWPANGGPEALVMLPGGKPLVIAEQPVSGNGVDAIVIGGRQLDDGKLGNARFTFTPPGGFQPTDAALLDDTRLLVLNRSYSPLAGVAMKLVEVGVDALREGATVSGREIAALKPPATLDNMEGIEVRRAGERIFIYLLSDNNFNDAQRTLLLKYELMPEPQE